jgi:hypothetical protein
MLILAQCGLFTDEAFAHPASGIVVPFFHAPYLRGLDVTEDGTVYVAVNGCASVVKITPGGKVETVLNSEQPWSPTGVAVRGMDVIVLEYPHTDKAKDWAPRVRKLLADGKVTILANLAHHKNKREP